MSVCTLNLLHHLTCIHTHTHTHTGVNCGPPESPAQGATNYTSTEYGAEAKYSCNAGYVLSGASVAVCNLDGTWSRPPPTCSSKLRAGPLASLRRPLFVTGFLKKLRKHDLTAVSRFYCILFISTSIYVYCMTLESGRHGCGV